MWIADQWKEYEVIDTSGGEKLERWGKIYPGPSGPAGYLGYPKGKPGLEKYERPLSQKQKRRRRMGVF